MNKSFLTSSLIFFGSMLATQASAREKSLVKPVFSCGISNGVTTTVFSDCIKKIAPIRWSVKIDSQWSPARRCEQVSQKFTQKQAVGKLEYIVPSHCNGQPVLCASKTAATQKWTSNRNDSQDSMDLFNDLLDLSKLLGMTDVITLLANNLSNLFKEKMMESQLIFKLSALEEDILTVLSSQNMYGLQIIKQLEKAHEGQRKIKEGSIYPTLHRMEKKKYIGSYWGEDRPEERGGARRKYYKITEAGIQVLNSRFAVRQRLSSLELQLCPV